MKYLKVLLGLALAVGLSTLVRASGTVASVSVTTGTGGVLLSQGWQNIGGYPPTTYTAKSTIGASYPGSGSGVVITKITGYSATWNVAATWALWDCPQGLTYVAGARIVAQGYIPASATANTIADFGTQAAARTDEDGISFRYFPVWVDNGTNTIVATVQYRPFYAPTQSGAAK